MAKAVATNVVAAAVSWDPIIRCRDPNLKVHKITNIIGGLTPTDFSVNEKNV